MAQNQAQKGFFISFEGGEGSGKTTHIRLLKDYLVKNGQTPVITREPGGTDEAERLRQILVDQQACWSAQAEAMILFAARDHHVRHIISPALEKGQSVICDRFTDSTRAYQGVAMGLGVDFVDRLKEMSIGDLEPDITYIMDIPPIKGLERARKRAQETGEGDHKYENFDMTFHQKLYAGYLEIAEKNPERCYVIDADRSIEDIHNDVLKYLEEKVRQKRL